MESASETRTPPTDKVAKKAATRSFRAAQRAKGLRLVKIWVPDTRLPEVAAMIRRTNVSHQDDPQERETLDWIERNMDYSGWS